MEKLDFKKTMKGLFAPKAGAFEIIDVPKLRFVMVDGRGDPNVALNYQAAVSWIYTVSYKLKFMSKATGRDYSVPPMQATWWAEDLTDFRAGRKDRWLWTVMIMQPDWVTPAMFEEAVAAASVKLGSRPDSLRLEEFEEGLSVQTLHIGPYAAESATIARLHDDYLPANGLAENGKHHEIYLSDPRRAPPEKLKTIIRQPVRRA